MEESNEVYVICTGVDEEFLEDMKGVKAFLESSLNEDGQSLVTFSHSQILKIILKNGMARVKHTLYA